jgi:hypothetical protein
LIAMIFTRRLQAPVLLAAGLCGFSLALPAAASAQVYVSPRPVALVPVYQQVPVYQAVPVYQPMPTYAQPVAPVYPAPAPPYQDYNTQVQAPYTQPAPTTWQEAQALQQRCSIGRLVGGVVGGGIGYAASRDNGRTWAVPLGALLGTQMGCNAGQGRAPLPW